MNESDHYIKPGSSYGSSVPCRAKGFSLVPRKDAVVKIGILAGYPFLVMAFEPPYPLTVTLALETRAEIPYRERVPNLNPVGFRPTPERVAPIIVCRFLRVTCEPFAKS